MRGGKEVCNGSPLRRYAPALPEGEPLACRSGSCWTPEARQGAKGRALLQRAAASGQAHLVKLLLAWTAEHYRSRDIVLCSSRRKLTDMPRAPPLGELAGASPTERASRLSQSRCTAISRLFVRAILSQCKSCLSASLPSPSAAQTPLPEGEALAFRIVSCIFLAKFMIYLFCGLARPFYWEGGEHHESIFISYPVRRSKHNFTLCLQVA